MSIKQVETVMTTKFTGSTKAVAAEANMKVPDNPEEVIARNTTRTIDENAASGAGSPLNGEKKPCQCGMSCCGAR